MTNLFNKIAKSIGILISAVLIFSCASTKPLAEGEELVKYVKVPDKYENKKFLTPEELRQECDMLKYLLYNCYAGIEESMECGLDLDAAIEKIYKESMDKKDIVKNLISSEDFASVTRQNLANNMYIEDQHIAINGNHLKDSTCVFYSNVYFEKNDNGEFRVKKVEEEKEKGGLKEKVNVNAGSLYTGNESNLFEMLTDEGVLYRFGVITKQRIKSAVMNVDGEKISVPVKTEKTIHQKNGWTGLKQTSDTMYVSLSDCFNFSGLSNQYGNAAEAFKKDLEKIAEAAKGKKNIVFDLRSNTGGYPEFPTKILTAAMYNQHRDEEFSKEIMSYLINTVEDGVNLLVSPYIMQKRKDAFGKDNALTIFDEFSDERKAFYKDYWKSMKRRPVRKFVNASDYKCNLKELPETDFTGNLYILINSQTASAAEMGTCAAFLFENKGINVKLIGENTCGAIEYISLWTHWLPVSGMSLYLPSAAGRSHTLNGIKQFKGEGKGFYPDYWATSDTILNTLYLLTGDEELKETLKGLDKEML